MEQQQEMIVVDDQSNNNGNGKQQQQQQSSFLCRQSSTRWTPTSEQIRILKDLYYNNGVRSPSAEQIQRISAKLRQYGKIEGKNVFYWFQNHKARERQKKRLSNNSSEHHHLQQQYQFHVRNNNPVPGSYNNFPGFASSSSSSMAMEKSFRECSINNAWVDVNEYHHHHPHHHHHHPQFPFIEMRNYNYGHEETLENQEEDENTPEIETLPLFPIHGDEVLKNHQSTSQSTQLYRSFVVDAFSSAAAASSTTVVPAPTRASLELTLNSFFGNNSDNNNNNYM